jgi:alpha-L-rhamnosidase
MELWQTNSSQSIHINYSGKPLRSATKYFWKVKVFTNKGEAQQLKRLSFLPGY